MISYSLVLPQDLLQVPDFWNVFLFCSAKFGSYLSVSFCCFWVSALLSCG